MAAISAAESLLKKRPAGQDACPHDDKTMQTDAREKGLPLKRCKCSMGHTRVVISATG
jgi:hypothetical protein